MSRTHIPMMTDQFLLLEAHFKRFCGVCLVLLNVWLMNYDLDRSGNAQGYRTHVKDDRSFNIIFFVGASFSHDSYV